MSSTIYEKKCFSGIGIVSYPWKQLYFKDDCFTCHIWSLSFHRYQDDKRKEDLDMQYVQLDILVSEVLT